MYKAEFKNRGKQKGESYGDFGNDLLRLVDKAFLDLQLEGKEQLALSHYLGRLDPMHILFGVKQH